MQPDDEVLAILTTLQKFPELDGCMVGYEGDGECRVLDYGARGRRSACLAVIIEEMPVEPDVNAELAQIASADGTARGNANQPALVANESRLGPELIGAGISCGLTIVSAFGVLGGAAAEVPTGGASTFLVVASWSGLTMGGIQCLNGLVRVGAIFAAPTDNTLQRWDSNLSYSMAILIVDAIGIASGVASLPFAARNLWATLARQRAFAARGLSFESLRAMKEARPTSRFWTAAAASCSAGRCDRGRYCSSISVITLAAAVGRGIRRSTVCAFACMAHSGIVALGRFAASRRDASPRSPQPARTRLAAPKTRLHRARSASDLLDPVTNRAAAFIRQPDITTRTPGTS